MPQTAITKQAIKGPYPGTVSANDLDFTFAASDNSNGNSFVLTGREILLVQNTTGAPLTFTITSVADALQRTGDVTTYSLGANEFAAFSFVNPRAAEGWQQSDGKVYLASSGAGIEYAVITV